jgi:hypothetical protein
MDLDLDVLWNGPSLQDSNQSESVHYRQLPPARDLGPLCGLGAQRLSAPSLAAGAQSRSYPTRRGGTLIELGPRSEQPRGQDMPGRGCDGLILD